MDSSTVTADPLAEDIRSDGETSGDKGLEAAKRIAATQPELDRENRLEPAVEKDVTAATGWLLQAFDERDQEVVERLKLNVGSESEPEWIKWAIRSVEGGVLRAIRARSAEQFTGKRGQRALLDDSNAAYRANCEIVLVGTAEPDLVGLAAARQLADVTYLLEEAFRRKPGLIDMLSAKIMSLSGYDDDAVRDDVEVAAAGNSPG